MPKWQYSQVFAQIRDFFLVFILLMEDLCRRFLRPSQVWSYHKSDDLELFPIRSIADEWGPRELSGWTLNRLLLVALVASKTIRAISQVQIRALTATKNEERLLIIHVIECGKTIVDKTMIWWFESILIVKTARKFKSEIIIGTAKIFGNNGNKKYFHNFEFSRNFEKCKKWTKNINFRATFLAWMWK